MNSEFLKNYYIILEQSSIDDVDKVVNQFCQYYKNNDQMLRFLEKYEQFVSKFDQDREIYDEYKKQLTEGEFSKQLVKEILIWLTLIIPNNCRSELKYHLVNLCSYIGGLYGRDDQITFSVINLKSLCEEKELYFVYKPQQKVVLSKMIYNREKLHKLYGYVKKYVGNGIEKAL